MIHIRFKDRVFEWWLAANTFGFGCFLGAGMESMDSLAFSQLTRWFPEEAWAAFFAITGFLHLIALIINGRRWWTPFIRSGTTALNLAAYVFFGLGFMLIDPSSTAVYSYTVMIGSAAAICFFRAMKDAVHALEARARDAH